MEVCELCYAELSFMEAEFRLGVFLLLIACTSCKQKHA